MDRKRVIFIVVVLIVGINQILAGNKLTKRDSVRAARMHKAATTVLKPVYPYLANYITETFNLEDKEGIGIDIGGGAGDLVIQLCKHTSSMYWINADINPWYFSIVADKVKRNNCYGRISSIQADVTCMPFRSNFADMIVSRGSFHFWDNLKKGLSEIKRVLKPGGSALIGRGFSPNMPLDSARLVRDRQKHKIGGYNPENFAKQFTNIMKELNITQYDIIIPKTEKEINYGIWLKFNLQKQ